jgi:hypothetical protein
LGVGYFNIIDFSPGETLVAQLAGLPQSNQGATTWAALVLLLLVGGFGTTYLVRKSRLQPERPTVDLTQKKEELLVELARLDDEFESGRIPEEVYRRLRTERKSQLVGLMQGSKEKPDNR